MQSEDDANVLWKNQKVTGHVTVAGRRLTLVYGKSQRKLRSESPAIQLPSDHCPLRISTGTTAIMSLTNCRFYEEKYPDVDSLVMVNVRQVAEMGA